MANILIIEDDNGFRQMLRRMLEKAGFQVCDAPDGSVGLELCKDNAFDIVITDIFMPQKEGIETIFKLKKSYPDLKIIAISGGGWKGTLDYLDQVKYFGVEKAFKKPLNHQAFMETIDEMLRQ